CPHACRERAPRPFAARSPENTTTRGRLECRILAPRVAGIAPPWTTALTAGPNSGRQSRIRRPALPPPAPDRNVVPPLDRTLVLGAEAECDSTAGGARGRLLVLRGPVRVGHGGPGGGSGLPRAPCPGAGGRGSTGLPTCSTPPHH